MGIRPPSVVPGCGAAVGGDDDAGKGLAGVWGNTSGKHGPKGELGLGSTLPQHPRVPHPRGRLRQHTLAPGRGLWDHWAIKPGVPAGLCIPQGGDVTSVPNQLQNPWKQGP